MYSDGRTWRHYSKYNNPSDCRKHGGMWFQFNSSLTVLHEVKSEQDCQSVASQSGVNVKWVVPYVSADETDQRDTDPEKWKRCIIPLPEPDCQPAPSSRPNHLGNGEGVEALQKVASAGTVLLFDHTLIIAVYISDK